MRFLGFVFVIVLLVAAVGLYRDWFSFSTANAADSSTVVVGITPQARNDVEAAAGQIGRLSKQLSEKVGAIGKAVPGERTELRGTITSVNATQRHLAVEVAHESLAFDVAQNVAIVRAGVTVGFDQLSVNSAVKLLFEGTGPDRRLVRIEFGQ